MTKKGIGGHTKPNIGQTNDWLTPPDILQKLGEFDLDPCASIDQPWRTAKIQYTAKDNGLIQPWSGRIWCNPPYGKEAAPFLKRLSAHGNGIALIFARTETEMFFDYVWNSADAILFIRTRLHFHYPVTGKRAKGNSGGPSVLLAYGDSNVETLRQSGISGALVTEWQIQ